MILTLIVLHIKSLYATNRHKVCNTLMVTATHFFRDWLQYSLVSLSLLKAKWLRHNLLSLCVFHLKQLVKVRHRVDKVAMGYRFLCSVLTTQGGGGAAWKTTTLHQGRSPRLSE